MSAMRIGHFSNKPWAPGGIASYIRRLSSAQRNRGDDVVLLCGEAPEDEPDTSEMYVTGTGTGVFETATALNLDVLHLHRPVDVLPDDRVPTVRTMHGNQGACPSGSRYLDRTESPCNRTPGLFPCLTGHLVDHCGSRRPTNILANFANFRREQELSAQLPTMTVSAYVRDAMVDAGSPSEQLHVVHSPAPSIPGPIVPPPRYERPRFAFVGRMEANKGVEWFLRAVARCPVPIHVDLAGTGSDEYVQFLHRRIHELDLAHQVTVHGWLSESEVNGVYRRARAVVVPSLWHEPAGLVTLEAAASGRAVLTSRVGGIPEYAHPSFSVLCEPGNVPALSEHMASLANDWDRAWSMGKAAVDLMHAEFTMNAFLTDVDRVYGIAMDRDIPSRSTTELLPEIHLARADHPR